MSPRIIRIEDAGPDRKARRLIFDDGSPYRTTSAAAVKALGVEEGIELPLGTLEERLAEVEPELAKERGLRLLGYRERSRGELVQRLRDSGYPPALVQRTVARFEELGLVDDARFAELWVRTRASAGFGARRIERELTQRGIDPDTAAAAMAAVIGADEQLARARAALRGKSAADRKGREKLVRRLVTKGFELGIAYRAVQSDAEDDPGVSGD